MEPRSAHHGPTGHLVTRAVVVGVLLGLFGFVYFPPWTASVFLALGAVLGLAATVVESAVVESQR